MEDRRRAVALFRYSLIRELADAELSPRQRGALITTLAATDHAFDGRRVEVTGPTLRRWLRAWRAARFQALVPGLRPPPHPAPAQPPQRGRAAHTRGPR